MNNDLHNIGVHLIISPEYAKHSLPSTLQPLFEQSLHEISANHACTLKAMFVRADHVHILFDSYDEDRMESCIFSTLNALLDIVHSETPFSKFRWHEQVHITLLPPWHLEIVASFVRDQDRYHSTKSFKEELHEVFMPPTPKESKQLAN